MTGLRQVIRAREVPPKPWANGAGTTRELWAESGDDGRLEWRLSLADLITDVSFSTFPQVDRVFVPLVCHGHTLSIDGESQRLVPLSPVRLAGEAVVALSAPTPGLALNLMTRRGVDVDLTIRSLGAGELLSSRTPAVVVLTGRLGITGGPVIGPLDVALLDAAVAAADGTDAVVAEVWVG